MSSICSCTAINTFIHGCTYFFNRYSTNIEYFDFTVLFESVSCARIISEPFFLLKNPAFLLKNPTFPVVYGQLQTTGNDIPKEFFQQQNFVIFWVGCPSSYCNLQLYSSLSSSPMKSVLICWQHRCYCFQEKYWTHYYLLRN